MVLFCCCTFILTFIFFLAAVQWMRQAAPFLMSVLNCWYTWNIWHCSDYHETWLFLMDCCYSGYGTPLNSLLCPHNSDDFSVEGIFYISEISALLDIVVTCCSRRMSVYFLMFFISPSSAVTNTKLCLSASLLPFTTVHSHKMESQKHCKYSIPHIPNGNTTPSNE